MQIAGFVKNSFVDYPSHIAAAIFVSGCNMDCWYCHNRQLWDAKHRLDQNEIVSFLQKRRGFLDGVVISGGEPTLQKDLKSFIADIRSMGYLIKLDTNGLKPDVVESLLGLVDYVALDLKTPPGQLDRVVSFDLDDAPIWLTADMLLSSGVDYEFRTTFIPLLTLSDIVSIAQRVNGAKKFVLQQYRHPEGLSFHPKPHTSDTIKKAAEAAKEFVQCVQIKGL